MVLKLTEERSRTHPSLRSRTPPPRCNGYETTEEQEKGDEIEWDRTHHNGGIREAKYKAQSGIYDRLILSTSMTVRNDCEPPLKIAAMVGRRRTPLPAQRTTISAVWLGVGARAFESGMRAVAQGNRKSEDEGRRKGRESLDAEG